MISGFMRGVIGIIRTFISASFSIFIRFHYVYYIRYLDGSIPSTMNTMNFTFVRPPLTIFCCASANNIRDNVCNNLC